MKQLELNALGVSQLSLEHASATNGGNDVLVWWEALGDAINAMNNARSAYAIDQAVGLYQSLLAGGREAGIW